MDSITREVRNQKVRKVPANIYDQGTGSSELTKRIKYLSKEKEDLIGDLNAQKQKYDIKLNIEKAKVRNELTRDLTKVSAENAKLKSDKEVVSIEIKKCKTEKKQLEESITKISEELNKEKEAKNALEKELEAKKNALEQKELELKAKKIDVNVYQCQEYKIEIKKLKLHINSLTRDIKNKTTIINTKKAEMSSLKLKLKNIINEKDAKFNELNTEYEKYKTQCTERLEQILKINVKLMEDKEKEKASHETNLKKLEDEKAILDSQILDLNKQLKNAEKLRIDEKGGSAKVVDELRKNVKEIKRDKTKLESKLEATEAARKLLNKQINSKNNLNTKLTEDLDKVREELEESKERYTTVSKQLSELQEEYKTLETQNKLTSSELRVYKSKEGDLYVELNQQLDSLKQSNARLLKLQSDLSDLESQLKTCNRDSIQKDAKIKELQQEKEALQKAKKDLQEAKDAFEKEKKDRITKLNTDKLVLEGKLAKITQEKLKEKEKADSEIKSLKSQTDFLRKNNTKVNEERQERQERLREEERLREDLRQKEEQIKGIETDIIKINSEYESRIQGLSLDIDRKDTDILRLKKELQESRENLNTCNSSNEVLKSDNEKLIKVRNKLQGNLTKCNQKYNKNRKTIQELQQQKKNIESRLSSQSSGEMDLLESKSLLEDRIKRLDSQLTGLNSEQERLKTLKSGLETQLQTCNSSNTNLQREKEKLNNQLETCRDQRKTVENHLNERIKNLNTQIDELKSEKQYLEQSRSEFKTKSKDRIGYEKEQFNDQIRKLNEIIRLKDEEISNVKEELENLRKEYNEKERQLLSEIERKNSEIEKLEGRLQASEFILKTEREDSQRLLERIKELDLARKDAEEVNKSIENDRIELQRGITSKHVEIQRLERELDSLKRKLTELENNPAADFDAYNQGMEEAKQNYIQQIQELQSRISGFDTEKKRMEIQLEECTKVRLELSSKINDLEKLVGNLKLENEKLKLENENLVKQVKDREAGSVKLNEKLKVENQKLIKEREMYSSQFQQTQKLQADNTRYEEIVKSLQEKLQSEILKNRGEKSVIENEYRQSLETIEELNKQLETSKKLLSENSSKLLQTQQMQALQSFQSSQASQDKIKELENINNLLREEITKISEQLRLKNSEISREGSSRILEIKNEEERLTGILKRLNTEIGFSEHQLRQLQENISKKKDISVVSSFNLSINDEEYDRIQRIIRNVERVTKKCDKLSVSKMNK